MAKVFMVFPDGSRREAETMDVPSHLQADIFKPNAAQGNRDLVLCTSPSNQIERLLLRAIVARMASKGHYCKLQPNASGLSLVAT